MHNEIWLNKFKCYKNNFGSKFVEMNFLAPFFRVLDLTTWLVLVAIDFALASFPFTSNGRSASVCRSAGGSCEPMFGCLLNKGK